MSHIEDHPISDAETDAAFAPFRGRPIVLAVSGGSDSMAMLWLFARWRARHCNAMPWAHVLTLDHGFRVEAAAEAVFVCNEAARLGLAATALHWDSSRVASGHAAAARRARYDLFALWIAQHAPRGAVLLTAHTRDDRAEGLLMRLQRGSGLRGLAGIEPMMRWQAQDTFCEVARPLLAFSKPRLLATIEAFGGQFVQDPTNSDPRSERARWRLRTSARNDLGLDDRSLSLTAHRLDRARQTVLHLAAMRAQQWVDLGGGLRATLRLGASWQREPEIIIVLLQALITAYGGQDDPVSLAHVESVHQAVVDRPEQSFARTLGGTRVEYSARHLHLRIEREATRRTLPSLSLPSEAELVWDGRFALRQRRPLPTGARIEALGLGQLKHVSLQWPRSDSLPPRAAQSLPVVRHEGRVVAFPLFDGENGPVHQRFLARGVFWRDQETSDASV